MTGSDKWAGKLEGLFEDLIDVAADRALDEEADCEFHKTDGEALARAQELAQLQNWDWEPVAGGYVAVDPRSAPDAQNGHIFCLTRKARQWRGFREEMDGIVRLQMDSLLCLRPNDFDGPLQASMDVYAGMKPENLPEDVEFNTDNIGPKGQGVRDQLNEGLDSVKGTVPVWEQADPIAREFEMANSSGAFFRVFNAYTSTFPSVCCGQMLVAGYLFGALKIAKTAFQEARTDAGDLATKLAKQLEVTEPDVVNVDAEGLFGMISAVLGVAGGIAGVLPGGQPLAGALGIASAATGFAEKIAGAVSDDKADNEFKIPVDSVRDALSSFNGELRKLTRNIDGIDEAVAQCLDELSRLTDDQTVVTGGGSKLVPPQPTLELGITLTRKDYYFRPWPPGERSADAAAADFDNKSEVLAIADPAPLLAIGDVHLPNLANAYRSTAGKAGGAVDGVQHAFTRNFQGYTLVGRMYPSWTELHGKFVTLLNESATNVDLAGDLVVSAVNGFTGQDGANAHNLTGAASPG